MTPDDATRLLLHASGTLDGLAKALHYGDEGAQEQLARLITPAVLDCFARFFQQQTVYTSAGLVNDFWVQLAIDMARSFRELPLEGHHA